MKRWGLERGVTSSSVPLASTMRRPRSWEEREPQRMEEPWVPVATAPPMVWSRNQEKAGSVQPEVRRPYLYSVTEWERGGEGRGHTSRAGLHVSQAADTHARSQSVRTRGLKRTGQVVEQGALRDARGHGDSLVQLIHLQERRGEE